MGSRYFIFRKMSAPLFLIIPSGYPPKYHKKIKLKFGLARALILVKSLGSGLCWIQACAWLDLAQALILVKPLASGLCWIQACTWLSLAQALNLVKPLASAGFRPALGSAFCN